jgi:hypothetical protein
MPTETPARSKLPTFLADSRDQQSDIWIWDLSRETLQMGDFIRSGVSSADWRHHGSTTGSAVAARVLSTPVENLTVPPDQNLTDRRGDEPRIVRAT